MNQLATFINELRLPRYLQESVAAGFSEIFDPGVNGAGLFIICKPTKSVLMGKRTGNDRHSNHWCPFGGTTEPGEEPMQTAIREVNEEAGIEPDMIHVRQPHLFLDEDRGFKFMSFLATCDNEFDVRLNDEHSDYGWFPIDRMPTPVHPGVNRMLAHPGAMRTILGSLTE